MKRIIAAVALASSIALYAHSHKPIEINSKIIRSIDTGTLNIGQIVITVNALTDLQLGVGDEKKGIIHFKGKACTLKELMNIESTLKKGNSKDVKCLTDSLNEAIDYIKKSTSYYRELQREHKTAMAAVVRQWSEQRDKQNSLLLKWAEMEEHAFVKTHASSAKKMNDFVDDLVIMLNDVRYSCKRSNARFEAWMEAAKKKGREQTGSQNPKDEL